MKGRGGDERERNWIVGGEEGSEKEADSLGSGGDERKRWEGELGCVEGGGLSVTCTQAELGRQLSQAQILLRRFAEVRSAREGELAAQLQAGESWEGGREAGEVG